MHVASVKVCAEEWVHHQGARVLVGSRVRWLAAARLCQALVRDRMGVGHTRHFELFTVLSRETEEESGLSTGTDNHSKGEMEE